MEQQIISELREAETAFLETLKYGNGRGIGFVHIKEFAKTNNTDKTLTEWAKHNDKKELLNYLKAFKSESLIQKSIEKSTNIGNLCSSIGFKLKFIRQAIKYIEPLF